MRFLAIGILGVFLLASVSHAQDRPRKGAGKNRFTPQFIEADLTHELRQHPDTTPKRIMTDYRTLSSADALRLATWFQSQPGVTVEVDTTLPTSRAFIEQARREGATYVEMIRDTTYTVGVYSAPARLTSDFVHTWATMLRNVPRDLACEIQGFGLLDK